MSKPSRRPGREEFKQQRKKARKVRKALREKQQTQGLSPSRTATVANHACRYTSVEEEREARLEAVTEQARVMRANLPVLLRRLQRIADPRHPKKLKHQLTMLMLYGILSFVLQFASRREANRSLSRPQIKENLRLLFPELEEIPHQDTLNRLLERIEPEEIEAGQIELVRRLIRKKKFQPYLVEGCYPVAIDGTQKLVGRFCWTEQWLEREITTRKGPAPQYYVYVVEAYLVFRGGMNIPLMSEFLDYSQGDIQREKQDCERRGLYRLMQRLKQAFPALPIMLVLDGLHAAGPAMERCRNNHWQFMIVLQDGSLEQVWEEYRGLRQLLEKQDRLCNCWADRRQRFHWVNDIEYAYGTNGGTKLMVHLVICNESWQEVDSRTAEVLTRHSRHAWLSSKRLSRANVLQRCNHAARHRWDIEEGILVEKRHGYHYEHCFSYSWNAMRGYHYLMRIAHLLNVLAQHSARLVKLVEELGSRGLIDLIRQTLTGPWLEQSQVRLRLAEPFQLRLP